MRAFASVVVSVFLLTPGVCRAVTLTVSPSMSTAAQGSVVDVAIRISELGLFSAPSLATYDLVLDFDSTVLSLSSVDFGDPILGDRLDVLGLGVLAVSSPAAGSVNLFELSFDTTADLNALQEDAFVLATVHLNAIGVGDGGLGLLVNALGDAEAQALDASTIINPLTIVVPEPSSTALLGLGLFAQAVAGRSTFGRGTSRRPVEDRTTVPVAHPVGE